MQKKALDTCVCRKKSGTGDSLEGQQGAAHIRTLTCPLSLWHQRVWRGEGLPWTSHTGCKAEGDNYGTVATPWRVGGRYSWRYRCRKGSLLYDTLWCCFARWHIPRSAGWYLWWNVWQEDVGLYVIDVGLLLPLYYHKRNEENMGRLWCITNWQVCVIYNNKMIERNDKRE